MMIIQVRTEEAHAAPRSLKGEDQRALQRMRAAFPLERARGRELALPSPPIIIQFRAMANGLSTIDHQPWAHQFPRNVH